MARKHKTARNVRKTSKNVVNRRNGDKGTKKQSSPKGEIKRTPKKAVHAALDVKLLLKANLFFGKDKKSVQLVGLTRRTKRGFGTGIKKIQDQEMAAKQFSKGAKFDRIAELLEAMGHNQRIRILIKLLGGDATHKLLSKETGLKAGPLYHHIRELRSAGLIGPKVRDLYTLSRKGRRAIMTALAMGRACK